MRRRVSRNYTPSAPKLRLIATQVSDQIGGIKRRVALRCRGYRMSNRSVKFVPALLAGVVAGANLAAMTDLRAQVLTTAAEAATSQATQAAADSCLTAPKGATPSGSHWYYRIDRVTKRQCWYLREESDTADDKFARAAPPASAPAPSSAAAPAPASAAEDPASPQPRAITRRSIADARAEWDSQQPRAE